MARKVVSKYVCKRCSHVWKRIPKLIKTKHPKRCPKCGSLMWDRNEEDLRTRCCGHGRGNCSTGLCRFDVMDWTVTRQVWRASPSKEGVVWKSVILSPVTTHECMIEFEITKQRALKLLKQLKYEGYMTRRVHPTPPPPEVHQYKQDVYSFKDGKRRRRGPQQKRWCKFQWIPTDSAMKKFLERYPDAVKLHRDSGILHFECKLVRVDRSRKPKIIRVIMSDKERAEYRQRFLDNLEKPPKLFGKTGIRRGR